MLTQTKSFLSLFSFLLLCLLSNNANARVFCNMDKAGGDKALDVQQQSAYAAGEFLMSATHAFEMFAEIEFFISGRQKSDGKAPTILSAKNFCGRAIEKLNSARNGFDNLISGSYAPAMQLVNAALDAKMKDPSVVKEIFDQASVSIESKTVKIIMEAYNNNKSEGLFTFVKSEIDVVSKAMQPVLKQLEKEIVPETVTLWKAIADWNRAFYVGRAIAAFFKVK